MNFSDIAGKRIIKKKIDNQPGEIPASVIDPKRALPEEVLQDREIMQTPIVTLVSDLTDFAKSTNSRVKQVIDEIVETSKSDPVFSQYAKLAELAHFDLSTLPSGSKPVPYMFEHETALQAAERDVYRRLVDPRAPFVNDLYRLKSEIGLVEYTLRNEWSRILQGNQLYNGYEGDRLFRMALYTEREKLRIAQAQTDAIQGNRAFSLSRAFIRGFMKRILNRIMSNGQYDPYQTVSGIDNVIKSLKTCRTFLDIALIEQTANWESFQTLIKRSVGDIFNKLAQKLIRVQSYATASALEEQILGFVENIEDALDIDIEGSSELLDFRLQLEHALFGRMSIVEDDMVATTRDSVEAEIARAHSLANSQRSTKTKQYVDAVNTTIMYLENLKSTILAEKSISSLNMESLINSVYSSATQYVQKVTTGPAKPLPELLDQRVLDKLNPI